MVEAVWCDRLPDDDTALGASSASLIGSAKGSGALMGNDLSAESDGSPEIVDAGAGSGSLFGIVEGDRVASLLTTEAARICLSLSLMDSVEALASAFEESAMILAETQCWRNCDSIR
jgi:hypothetical protein